MLERVQTLVVLIPAAGRGSRLGRGPKAFLPLGETSILGQTLKAFAHIRVIVGVSADMLDEAKGYAKDNIEIIVGGETRQETVYKLLQACEAEVVLIHDAARPFLAPEVIDQSVELAFDQGAVSVVKAVADTLINTRGETLNRDHLRAVQTPQTFRREVVLGAHELALRQNSNATDDAALVRSFGHEVALVEGSAWLDKITTAADYERAQALQKLWETRARA